MQPSNSKAALLQQVREAFPDRFVVGSARKGEVLFWEATDCESVFGIESGIAKLVRVGFHGKEWIVSLAGPGEFLALNDVLDRRAHRTSAVALMPMAVWKVPARSFREELERRPDLTATICRWLVHHVHDLELSLELFSNGRAEERIANLLARMAVACDGEPDDCRRLPFRLTRKDMSAMVGTTPETCSRALSDLKQWGILRETRDHQLHVRISALRSFFRTIENGSAALRPFVPSC